MRRAFVCVLAGMFALFVPAAVLGLEHPDDISCGPERNQADSSVAGLGVMVIESPYRGVDADVYPVPVFIFEKKQFFVDKTVAGYYFNDTTDQLRWAMIGSVRLNGYEAGDSSDLNGMQDRDWALDAGLRINWNNAIAAMTFEAVTDVSGTHKGQELRVSVFRELFEGFLTPKAGIRWQSDDLADYYYGVRPSEARAGRSAYVAQADLEYAAGLTIAFPLTEKVVVFGDIECTFLGDEAGDSPIVDDDTLMRYVTGVVYRF